MNATVSIKESLYNLRDELDEVKRSADLMLYELSEADNQEEAYQHMAEAFALLVRATAEMSKVRQSINS